ncbi:hypothetical protein HUT16_05035 [Kitasatospora sp. NA04385]|uniref:hypothetical protein n=1 Tax=Kitasatospora sp. NA04385 TaxID=2742135 RepID=UPI0015903821|nr:hypothetical protein [Kitasatospora sp. NA04385]QKW18515.1 hypothetical protein HUT16_05035 [Kitasatospora sp. NA04385]
MRSLRLAAATVVCLSAVALLSACDPEDTGSGDSAAATSAAASATASAPAAGAESPAAAKTSAAKTSAAATGGAAAGKAGRLPAGVWIDPKAVPLNSALHWKAPGSAAKALGESGKLRIEELCRIPRDDSFATVPMVETASLGGSAGDWAADETIASFGSAKDSSGRAQSAFALLGSVTEGLKGCGGTVPGASVKVTAEDSTFVAATLTVPQAGGGTVEVREYLSVQGGSVAELTLHAELPKGGHPKTAWAGSADAGVLDALGKTVCTALGDC